MGRAEWRVQAFCPQDKTLAQAEFISAEHFYKTVFSAAKPHPKPKPSVSGFGLERSRKGAGEGGPHLGVPSLSGLCGDEVDVGDNGNIAQFLIPHFWILLLIYGKTTRGPISDGARRMARTALDRIGGTLPDKILSDGILYR